MLLKPHLLSEVDICALHIPTLLYTPGIYADRYIVFAFPFVCSFVRYSGTFVEFMSKFLLKFLWWCISHEPIIRNHSYFNHRYPIRFALFL